MVIHELRERLHGLAADILLLQEVVGVHRGHAARHVDWPVKPQHEFIADTVWHEVAYGKNAISHHGHHGNAVLSRFPIVAHENLDISAHAFESRGLLHCTIELGPGEPALHCLNVHLGLFERGRKWQIHALCERIRATVPAGAPLVIAGDFNDWRHKANRLLVEELGVVEVFAAVRGRPARTFPSVHAGLPARPHLRARPVDRRCARALRVPLGAHLRPRGAGGHVRDRGRGAMNRFLPGNRITLVEQRRRVLSGAGPRDRSRASARSGWKPTSTPTTTSAGSSRRRSSARRGAASSSACSSTDGAPGIT